MKKTLILLSAVVGISGCSQTVTGPGPLNTVREAQYEYSADRKAWAKSLHCDGVTRAECDARLFVQGR